MADELAGQTTGQTGLTVYFILKNAVGLVRSGGTTFSTYNTSNRNSGAISATGRADGSYVATMPAVAAGAYYYEMYQQLGGSPAETDTLLAGPGAIQWNGTAVVPVGTLNTGAITDATITTPAEAAGLPTGILGMIRRLWESITNKEDRNRTTGVHTIYGADNTTPLQARTQSTAGVVDQITKGA
jgi:hypothetical protein